MPMSLRPPARPLGEASQLKSGRRRARPPLSDSTGRQGITSAEAQAESRAAA